MAVVFVGIVILFDWTDGRGAILDNLVNVLPFCEFDGGIIIIRNSSSSGIYAIIIIVNNSSSSISIVLLQGL